MIIPKLHYISQGISSKEHLENIQKACSSGVELVQLRLTNVSDKKYLKIAEEAREITSHFQTRLIIKDHYKIAKTVKADGVHLEASEICPTIIRDYLFSWQMIGGTANTLQDCETLISKDVDYIGLGPFRFSNTKDNLPQILGIKGYTAILDVLKSETPIIGAGGITTEDVVDILTTGVSGLAVSEAITRNFNSIKLFNQLLNASATEEKRHTFE